MSCQSFLLKKGSISLFQLFFYSLVGFSSFVYIIASVFVLLWYARKYEPMGLWIHIRFFYAFGYRPLFSSVLSYLEMLCLLYRISTLYLL